MKTTQRTVLLALVFAVIASTLLAMPTDAKRKRGSHSNQSRIVQTAPNNQIPELDPFVQIPNGQIPQVDPSVYEAAKCAAAEPVLNGFLGQKLTLAKTKHYWARLSVNQGVSVTACDLTSGTFGVRFNYVYLEQFVKVPVIGWHKIVPDLRGSLLVSFTVSVSSPSTIVLSNLNVSDVNIDNFPNSLDGGVQIGLDAIFPNTITITI